MALLGTFAYYTSAGLLQEISLRQLDALAESKRRDLIKTYDSWEDNLRLVRDESQLRSSIRDFVDRDDPEALRSIQRNVSLNRTGTGRTSLLSASSLSTHTSSSMSRALE